MVFLAALRSLTGSIRNLCIAFVSLRDDTKLTLDTIINITSRLTYVTSCSGSKSDLLSKRPVRDPKLSLFLLVAEMQELSDAKVDFTVAGLSTKQKGFRRGVFPFGLAKVTLAANQQTLGHFRRRHLHEPR
jgi:hypothetical protein